MAGQTPYLRLVSPGTQVTSDAPEAVVKKVVIELADQGNGTDSVSRGVRLIFVSAVILVLVGVLEIFLGSLRGTRPTQQEVKSNPNYGTLASEDRVVEHVPLIDKHFCRGLAIAQFCIELPKREP